MSTTIRRTFVLIHGAWHGGWCWRRVADLVVMLASPLMHMVNGTMIEIDGGQDKPLMDRFRDKNR